MNLILVDTKEDKIKLKSVFAKIKKRGNVCLSFVLQESQWYYHTNKTKGGFENEKI